MLWLIITALLILWLLGFFVVHVGSAIHILIVIIFLILIYDLLISRRRLP